MSPHHVHWAREEELGRGPHFKGFAGHLPRGILKDPSRDSMRAQHGSFVEHWGRGERRFKDDDLFDREFRAADKAWRDLRWEKEMKHREAADDRRLHDREWEARRREADLIRKEKEKLREHERELKLLKREREDRLRRFEKEKRAELITRQDLVARHEERKHRDHHHHHTRQWILEDPHFSDRYNRVNVRVRRIPVARPERDHWIFNDW